MARTCGELGARQLVKEPTRGPYLLDLAITDMAAVKASVIPGISDHQMVNVSLTTGVIIEERVAREVWLYQKADWDGVHDHLLHAQYDIGSDVNGEAQGLNTCTDECNADFHPRGPSV